MPRRQLSFDPLAEAERNWNEHFGPGRAMAAATSIMRAQQIVLSTVDDALRPLGLTFARWEALVLLSFTKHGEFPLGRMGERLMVHPTSVTNTIDRLERDGLVDRIPHPTDGRTTLARLTPAGRRLMHRATATVEATGFGLDALAEGEQRELFEVIRRLRVAHGDFDEASPETRTS